MRLVALAALALACTPARARRPADPRALQGVTLALPPPADTRTTPGIGCGMVSQDLAARAHKLLVAAFSDAGAKETLAEHAPWTLNVALREAGMGLENARFRRTDKPVQDMPEDAPSLAEPRASLFNSGNDNAAVMLEATLLHEGRVVWRSTVTGHARSAPCIEAVDKVREALADAVDEVRDRVITQISAAREPRP
jgi:hypothetical protein